MEIKSLFLGTVLTAAVFAAKSGMRLGECMEREKQKAKNFALCLAVICGYGLAFGISATGFLYADDRQPVQTLQVFLKGGMVLHFLMGVCMLVPGIICLKSDRNKETRLQSAEPVFGCLILMILSAVSAEIFSLYFPNTARWAVFCLCMGFIAIVLLSAHLSKHSSLRTLEKTAGAAMLTLSAYFFLSATVLPQFSDLAEIAGLAAHSQDVSRTYGMAWQFSAGMQIGLFALGYFQMSEQIRRTR